MFNQYRLGLLSFCLVFTALAISACAGKVQDTGESLPAPESVTETPSSTGADSSIDSSTASTQPEAELAPTRTRQSKEETVKVTPKTVQVFFPKSPNSDGDFTYVEPVLRQTTKEKVATFAIEQLIAGPSDPESGKGFLDPIQLQGSSNCGGDFQLVVAEGVAKLQFCKNVVSRGTGDDARAISAVKATLKQFSTVKSAIVLDKNGNCLGDQSGENVCLVSIAKPDKLTEKSKLAINGIGPVEVGMTVEEASRAAGVKITTNGVNPNPECVYYQPAGKLNGISFMVTDGRIARVDIQSQGITTISGAKVGDSEARIESLYPGQIEVTPHHYVQGGHYLSFMPKSSADRNYRVVFETDGQRVTEIRAGKLPEVEWVEGCS